MTYKGLFLDLDGTTIPNRPDGMPSQRVAEAIHRAKPRIHVCVATSRPLFRARTVLDHLDIRGLCVVCDSAQIYDPVKKKFVRTLYLDSVNVAEILRVVAKYSDRIFINSGGEEWLYQGGAVTRRLCSVFPGEFAPQDADELVAQLTKIPNVAVHRMPAWERGKIAVAVSHALATKQHAVSEVAKLLGMQTREMIGVGDGYNDFPMLMACGLKVAMGNAVDELKAIADFVAPSVDQDGVATVIEKFILT
jgi:hydroxymethylpyrimidine pyrophosphatase-like HAD family hydrolase